MKIKPALQLFSRSETQWTIAPVLVPEVEPMRPEWIRLPKPGSSCRYTSLKRSLLNSLILPCRDNDYKPAVKSVVLRKKGNTTGVRLIHLQSLLDFIESQST